MYITLAWTPLGANTHDDVEPDLVAALSGLKFRDQFPAYDGLFFANIVKGANQQEAQRLYHKLMESAPGRFTFVITISRNGEAPFPSDGLVTPSDPGFDKLEYYAT